MKFGILVAALVRAGFGHEHGGLHDEVKKDHSHGHSHSHSHSHTNGGQTVVNQAIASILTNHVFKYGARVNALLATVIIQAAPCILVFLIPGLKDIDTNTQDSIVMTILEAFALGTLLGDIFDHLLPETFEMFPPKEASFNLFIGFLGFLLMDKVIKILNGGGDGHGHSHGHSHSHTQSTANTNVEKTESNGKSTDKEINTTKYMHVITGLVHHMVDGLVLASSFYSSTATGVTTTVAVLCHEVPHEIGDFSIMISNGFSFFGALKAQLTIAISAIVGTAISCYFNEMGETGSSLQTDKLLPITAGGFIYMATTGILPRILAPNKSNAMTEATRLSIQLVCILVGFNMLSIIG
ncbi:Zinc transporter YKE4 [Nakaseomyces bracarensis]|uniref:Zinc transporter YKE4 n=1 Tax=Nakaseomyces bracarensis TaxID=273131 RepID=A0ABR4NX97_9SACH